MALVNRDTIWIGVGKLPKRKGFYLYEVDRTVLRVMAKFGTEADSQRFMKLAKAGLKFQQHGSNSNIVQGRHQC